MSAVCELVPLKRLARQASIPSSPIKNTVSQEYAPGLLPGYSASGQDVWLTPEQATFRGPGIVVSAVGARCGKSFLADGQWGVTANTSVVIPLAGTSSRYLWYLLNDEEFWIKGQTAQPYVQMGPSLMQLVPKLTTERQEAVASFLDRETAKIDALIAKQEQLIATLREDRTATITNAVTKGLDPEVQMKESGVEWIGRIPSHWKLSRIRYACDLLTGFPFESAGFTLDANETPLLRGTNVGVDQVDWADVAYWPSSKAPQFSRYQLAIGDIVMGLDRPFIGAGIRVARIGPNDVPSLLLQRVARMRATQSFTQDYLFLLLSGPGIVHHLTPMFTGVSVPHVSPSQVESLPIPEPPFGEQHEIAKYVTDKCKKVDRLIAKAGEAITTLREYRSALITDAVTGKIDVRGVA